MFVDDALTNDRFLNGRLHLLQPIKGYRAATDPVLLAAACDAQPGQRVLDIGCGAGTAALCLGVRVPDLLLFGLEVQADYADLARRNALRNGLSFAVHEGDLTQMPEVLREGFDQVISNPPYFPPAGTPSPVPGRAIAMQVAVPLTVWVAAAARRVAPDGYLTMICGADGLPDVLTGLGQKMGSVVVLPLAPRVGRSASRIIVRARKGGRAPFRLLAPFVLHEGTAHNHDSNSYTPEASGILRGTDALLAHFR